MGIFKFLFMNQSSAKCKLVLTLIPVRIGMWYTEGACYVKPYKPEAALIRPKHTQAENQFVSPC